MDRKRDKARTEGLQRQSGEEQGAGPGLNTQVKEGVKTGIRTHINQSTGHMADVL